MAVRNEEKKAFRDLTPEERGEIVKAWLSGGVEYFRATANEWVLKGAEDSLFSGTIYRTRPRQLVIPWEVIRSEYK